MAKYLKDVLKHGTYRLPDGRRVSYSRADINKMMDRLNEMNRAGLQVPVAWAHQSRAKPTTEEERLSADEEARAWRAKYNLGFAEAADAKTGQLTVRIDVPDEDNAKRLPSVRHVSPEIITDYVDGSGRLWPGKSITHIAVTSRPVQYDQGRFVPVQLSADTVWLAMEDYEMNDEEKPDEAKEVPDETPVEESAEAEGDGTIELPKLMELLTGLGIHLPPDTTDANFRHRLYVAMTQASGPAANPPGSPDDAPSNAPVSEETQGVMMSMEAEIKLLKKQNQSLTRANIGHERDNLDRRIHSLFSTGRIEKPLRDKMIGELTVVQMSLDDDAQPVPTRLAMKVEAYEALAGKSLTAPRSAVQMSADAPIVEHAAPDGPPDARAADRKFAAEQAKLASRD